LPAAENICVNSPGPVFAGIGEGAAAGELGAGNDGEAGGAALPLPAAENICVNSPGVFFFSSGAAVITVGAVLNVDGVFAGGGSTSRLLASENRSANPSGPAATAGSWGGSTTVGAGGSAAGGTFVCRLRLWKTTSKPAGA
jgi:hypothetical protein